MWYGYSIDRWVGLGEWALIVLFLFIGACLLSVILNNYYLYELKRKERLNKIRKLIQEDENNGIKSKYNKK